MKQQSPTPQTKAPMTPAEEAAFNLRVTEMRVDHARRAFDEKVASIQQRLERMATDIAREADANHHNPAKIAERIQHELLWGLANIGLDDLTRLASDHQGLARAAATLRAALPTDETTA